MLISYSILRLFDRKKKKLDHYDIFKGFVNYLKMMKMCLPAFWCPVCIYRTELFFLFALSSKVPFHCIERWLKCTVLKKKKLNMLRFCKNTDAQFVSLISGLCGWVVIWGITPLRALHSYLFTSSHIPPIPKSPSFQTKTQDLMHEASHAGCLSGGHCH